MSVIAKWNTRFKPEVIVKKLAAMRSFDGDRVLFNGFDYYEDITVLKSMIDVDEQVSAKAAQVLIERGFHEAAKKEVLTSKSVIEAVKKAVREHLKKPVDRYWLVTTIGIDLYNEIPRYSINGCSMRFYQFLPRKYRASREKLISEVSSWLIDKDDDRSLYVVVSVADKSQSEAVEKMLDAVDLLRGIWNLHVNKAMVLSFGGPKKPVNQILLGALHSLHERTGKAVPNRFWYEPEYFKGHAKVDLSKNEYSTLKFTENVRKSLKRNKCRSEVETAIIRYSRALDSRDYNAVFVKLWSLLEYLTNTLRDNYDTTIRRAVFQYSDHEYSRQVLEHLRKYRNRFVHLGAGEDDIDAHVYQLKSFVENLLRFHIANYFKFESLADAARFMELKSDKEVLKKQIFLCKARIKFMSE